MANAWRMSGSVQLRCDAPPEVVYARVADVTSTGQRSNECRSCEWLPGSPPGTLGARFRGRNRSGVARWSRVCEVVSADPARHFAFRTVPERFDPSRADSTIWSYDIEPDGSGSVVRHEYRIVKLPMQPFRWLYGRLLPHHRDMRPAMMHTLQALRAELQSERM